MTVVLVVSVCPRLMLPSFVTFFWLIYRPAPHLENTAFQTGHIHSNAGSSNRNLQNIMGLACMLCGRWQKQHLGSDGSVGQVVNGSGLDSVSGRGPGCMMSSHPPNVLHRRTNTEALMSSLVIVISIIITTMLLTTSTTIL